MRSFETISFNDAGNLCNSDGRINKSDQQNVGQMRDEQEEKFLSIVSPTQPHALRILPLDLRSISAAAQDRSILMESNSRGALRRSLAAIALELTQ